jgi:CHAT domain-containing protein
MKFFVTAILLFFIFTPCFSQTWKELTDSLSLYYKRGEFEKAATIGEKAVIAANKEFGENHINYATSLHNLGFLYNEMGLYEKAEPPLIQSNEIRKKLFGENHTSYAFSLSELADLYSKMGLYAKTEQLYLQTRDIQRKAFGEKHGGYANSLISLGVIYHLMGRYEKAEPLMIQGKEIHKKLLGENHPTYAICLSNLATLYNEMGQYEKAEPLYIQANEIRKKQYGEDHPGYAISLNNLAVLYNSMGQYEKAESLFTQAMEIRKKVLGESNIDYAQSLNNLAALYKTMGRFEKAETLYMQANEINRKVLGENHPNYANSLNNLAVLYRTVGQHEKAESLFIQAKDLLKKLLGETHPSYAINLDNMADLYERMGQYERAEQLKLLSNQIDLSNLKNNFTVLSEKEKGNYIKNKIQINEYNNSFIYNYRKASSSIRINNFNQQLVFKSLTLADTRNILASIRQNPDSAVQQLLNDWQKSKNILTKQYAMPVTKRRADLKQVETRTEELEKELSRASSAFRNQQAILQITLQDVQKNLQRGEAAIEFVRFKLYNKKWTDSVIYAAYVLLKNKDAPEFVPLCEEKQLQQLFDKAGKTATSLVSSFYRGGEVVNTSGVSLGTDLYKLIWEPLEPYLKSVKKISYSPAGKLYSIAFHALPLDSKKMLMDKYQLTQYTSTRQVALRSQDRGIIQPQSITLFGDARFTIDSLQLVKQKTNQPEKENISTAIYTAQNRGTGGGTWVNLPGTATEIDKIRQLFDQNRVTAKIFTQAAASEENLKALGGNPPQILHIATHGFFLTEPDKGKKEKEAGQSNTYTLADDPLLRSGLILAGGNYAWSGNIPIEGVEDGIATAYEISQLNLSNTELVVLSACETALGDVKGSEGVFGLQRAFKMAGVKKMIVSLWQVPDKETAELMTSFYSYWMKGKSISQAFTQAQADMRKKYAPFYWAAFVLVE